MQKNLSTIEGMQFKSDEEVLNYLSKVASRVDVVHEDSVGMTVVAYSQNKPYNINIFKNWADGTRKIEWSKEYSLLGRAFLKLGIFYIGIKDMSDYEL